MKRLIVDFYNQYSKFCFKPKYQKSFFFKSVMSLKERYNCTEVYYVFDGPELHKKTIDPLYKSNRNAVVECHNILRIQDIIKNLPKSYLVKCPVLEADDMSFNICKAYDYCYCISEDRDWLINLTANSNIFVYQKDTMLHSFNFEQQRGFPISKIPLFLFLSGDSKDGVKKPFRLRGNPLQNTLKHDTIESYCNENSLDMTEVNHYKKLVFPIEDIPFQVYVGNKTERTKILLKEDNLKFLDRNPNANLCY